MESVGIEEAVGVRSGCAVVYSVVRGVATSWEEVELW